MCYYLRNKRPESQRKRCNLGSRYLGTQTPKQTGCKHYRSECQMTPFEFRSLKGIVQWRTKWVAKGPSILLILKNSVETKN